MQLLTKHEAAKVLRVSKQTVDKLRKAGVLPWRKISEGRVLFSTSDLEDYVAKTLIR